MPAELCADAAGCAGDKAGCLAGGWRGCCRRGVAWFGGDLPWPGQGQDKPRCCPWGAARSRGLSASLCPAAATRHRGRWGSGRFPGKARLPHGRYLLSPQFWAVVSGQQQRLPHIQLLRTLGNHRLPGHTAGAAGRERAGSWLPRQSHAAPLTLPERELGLALLGATSQLLFSQRLPEQPWPLPRAVGMAELQGGQPPSNPPRTLGGGCWPGTGGLSPSSHRCPSAALSPCPWRSYGGPAPPCPVVGVCTLLPPLHPRRALPVCRWLFHRPLCSQPRIPSPDPACGGRISLHPSPFTPPPALRCEG